MAGAGRTLRRVLRLRRIGRVLAVLTTCLVAVFAPATAAEPRLDCDSHEHYAGLLSRTYGQEVRLSMLTGDGRVLEFWASESGGWTVLSVIPGRFACVLSRGTRWLAMPLVTPGDPA